MCHVLQVSIGDFVEVTPPADEAKDGDGQAHFYVVRVTEMFQDLKVSIWDCWLHQPGLQCLPMFGEHSQA